MLQKQIIIDYKEYLGAEELSVEERELLDSARAASKAAYAPYSKFNVGAAVRLSNGEIISANNQENAAFPSGLCAERVAMFYAHAKYPEESIDAIAIVSGVNGKMCSSPTYPCGACRQVMVESQNRGGRPIKIIVGSAERVQIMEGISALLPFTFDKLPER